jgi:polar amino acid transport system substrate-binding protein
VQTGGVIDFRGRAWPFLVCVVLAVLAFCLATPSRAQAPTKTEIVPDVWQGDVLRPKPDFLRLEKLRFVTDNDYPPFHYFDEEGVLTGFNVDLAKAICEVLQVECDIKPVSWDDLFSRLDSGDADAAIASIRITEEALTKADFSSRYYATPARFIAKKSSELKDVRPETVTGLKIGVAKGTSHEAYLKTFFKGAHLRPFASAEEAQQALKEGKVDLVFGDGIGLTFWINGVTSDGCCEFRGGPYLSAKYFGEGVGIAVKRGNRKLVEVLNYALEQVHDSGRYEELFLRYFPMNFF